MLELLTNPWVALVLHRPTLGRQFRIEGRAERLPAGETQIYFQKDQRYSQTSDWASRRIRVIASCATLEEQWEVIRIE